MNGFDGGTEEIRSHVRSRMRGDLPPQFVEDVMREVNRTPQRRSGWMGWPMVAGLATVAAAIAVVAISLSVIDGDQVGSDATPTPSPSLIARGTFVERDWGLVEFEATRAGSTVTGRMTIGEGRGPGWPLTVDLQCTRATQDGLILIGGALTDDGPLDHLPAGTLAYIALERRLPGHAAVQAGPVTNVPGSLTTDCLAYLDAWLQYKRSSGTEWVAPFSDGEGTVELGPFLPDETGSDGTNVTPSPSTALLARGNFVTNDGVIELEATGEGSTVTGRLTVSVEGDYAFTVDLQCTRTTEDGLILIGGATTDSTSRHVSAEGTWAAIALEPATPVEAAVWSHRGGSPSDAASCVAFLDEQLVMEECCRNSEDPPDWLSPIEGTVEFGP